MFNIQQLHVLPTVCVLYFISELTATFATWDKLIGFYNRNEKSLLRGTAFILNKTVYVSL
jgi:hypothetical protein